MFALAGSAYLLAVSIPLARIDIREHRLPNRLVLPAIPIALVGQLVESAASGQWYRLGTALGCAGLTFVIALACSLSGALGMGDTKLLAAMSLSLGWFSALAPILAVSVALVGALVPATVLVANRKTRPDSKLPLGPYLLVGFAVALATQFSQGLV